MLSPAERDALRWIALDPTRPFCSKDLIEQVPRIKSKGTARNVIWKFSKKLAVIESYAKSRYSFYKLKSIKRSQMTKPVTIYPMGVSGLRHARINLFSLLESIPWEELCKVHDIRLIFESKELYESLVIMGIYKPDPYSKDIPLSLFPWTNYRSIQVICHNSGKVSLVLDCSNCPVETSAADFVDMAAFLGGIRNELLNLCKAQNMPNEKMPLVADWLVVAWHYGRDSAQEFSGEAFNITFKMWCGILARIYTHHQDKKQKVRIEVAQTPNKSLKDLASQKLNLCCERCQWCSKP